jgi:hypothetical protein
MTTAPDLQRDANCDVISAFRNAIPNVGQPTYDSAPKAAIAVLETLSNEQHASWLAAVERIEELMEEEQ